MESDYYNYNYVVSFSLYIFIYRKKEYSPENVDKKKGNKKNQMP